MRTLSSEEQQKDYAKYYALNLFPPAFGLKKHITRRLLAPENMVPLQDRHKLLECDIEHSKIGYGYAPDGTGYVSTFTYMPQVTSDMIDWWFVWHGQESARYVIWDKEDHYSVKTTKLDRLTDETIPMRERLWGVTHTVLEDTGCGPEEITINFGCPYDFFEKTDLDSSPIETVIWGNGSSAVMCHTVFSNPEGRGVILCSHFWMGYQLDGKNPVKIIPEGVKIPEIAIRGLALHSIKEYANLGHFLPYLYAEVVENKEVLLTPVIA